MPALPRALGCVGGFAPVWHPQLRPGCRKHSMHIAWAPAGPPRSPSAHRDVRLLTLDTDVRSGRRRLQSLHPAALAGLRLLPRWPVMCRNSGKGGRQRMAACVTGQPCRRPCGAKGRPRQGATPCRPGKGAPANKPLIAVQVQSGASTQGCRRRVTLQEPSPRPLPPASWPKVVCGMRTLASQPVMATDVIVCPKHGRVRRAAS